MKSRLYNCNAYYTVNYVDDLQPRTEFTLTSYKTKLIYIGDYNNRKLVIKVFRFPSNVSVQHLYKFAKLLRETGLEDIADLYVDLMRLGRQRKKRYIEYIYEPDGTLELMFGDENLLN